MVDHLGFDTFILWPMTEPLAQLEVFAREVVPAVRQRVAERRGGVSRTGNARAMGQAAVPTSCPVALGPNFAAGRSIYAAEPQGGEVETISAIDSSGIPPKNVSATTPPRFAP